VLFGVVAAPIAVAIVLVGGAALAAMLAVMAALGAWELFRIARTGGLDPMDNLGIVLAAILPLVVHARFLQIYSPDHSIGMLSLASIVLLVVLAAGIWTRGPMRKPLSSVAVTVFGVAYTGGMLSYGYAIRYHPYALAGDASFSINGWQLATLGGGFLLLLPLLLTWASDIGAYVVGRTFGRHKLIPSVSPGKTVEGAIGGLLASVFVAWLYTRGVLQPVDHLSFKAAPWGAIAFGVLTSIAAQVGDLAESLLKREAGVKDSSHLIPGHGGILDRFDSLLFVMPVSYVLLGWWLTWAP